MVGAVLPPEPHDRAGLVAGIVVGKIAADVLFYALAIVGYELGRTLIPKPTPVPKPTPTTIDAYDRAAVSR